MKFCKKLNSFCCFTVAQAFGIIQPLRNSLRGEDGGFCYEVLWGGGGVSKGTVT